ncbi:CaiB/BaiF CoA-transferase family protein [Pseudonocardia hydrocarbonoxydans]|jgi:formyl-CoA transferase|uniref:CoA transferase n=1 Tax=Pseudonocardia hydrocarbonoxydans TaxID=76726 RepID=A0A4Y3WX44_9PSEU|nr:CoA transferase [Pseudonocardia hydrocarbonoxydans]
MRGPLDGVRVLEAGTLIAGPFCGQLLGDFGAEVIKIEDPVRGDPMRQWRTDDRGRSLWWPVIARNKRSVTCNLRDADGQALVRELVARSDVLVENFRPGTLERWGLGFDELQRINPRLVLVRVTGYGQSGPYAHRAGFGSVGEAMGGLRYVTGEPDRPPSRAGISIGDSLAGTFAALGAVMALFARQTTGRGQVVDSAIYEAVLAMMECLLPEWEVGGIRRERTGAVLPGIAPSNVYPSAEGADVLIAANRDTVFERLCEAMGRPELATDPRFADHGARGEHAAELDAIVAGWSAGLPTDDLLRRLHDGGVPAGVAYTAEDVLADEHVAARDAVVRLVHRQLGEFPVQNVVPKLSDTPGRVSRLGPELGEDNDEVFGRLLGIDAEELGRLRSRGVV